MKLKKFRISYVALVIVLMLLAVGAIVYTFLARAFSLYTSTGMFFINIISYGACLFFCFFQLRLIIQSFRNGTLLLNQICFTPNHKRRKITGIIASVIFLISITQIVIFLLLRFNIFSSTNIEEYLTYEYLIFFGIFLFIESYILLSYYVFLRLDDQTSIK